MSVRGADTPEKELRLEYSALVGRWGIASFQQIKDPDQPRSAFALVFSRGRNGQGLAAILLRQAQQACVRGPSPVEPFDDQGSRLVEVVNLGLVDREAEGAGQLQAVNFILAAV